MSCKYCLLVAVCIFFSFIGTEGNIDTCRVAGLCGIGGSFKQLTFNFSSVGGMPVVQVSCYTLKQQANYFTFHYVVFIINFP